MSNLKPSHPRLTDAKLSALHLAGKHPDVTDGKT